MHGFPFVFKYSWSFFRHIFLTMEKNNLCFDRKNQPERSQSKILDITEVQPMSEEEIAECTLSL